RPRVLAARHVVCYARVLHLSRRAADMDSRTWTAQAGGGRHDGGAAAGGRGRLTRRVGACAVALVLATLACGRGDAGGGTRVVRVSKQINEFLYDIHAESVLVARDLTSVYPPAITKLPSVGYHRALSAEGIISMRPTMLLTDGNLGPDAVVAQVKK